MQVAISFTAAFRYAESVSFSIHLYRLFPRSGRGVVVQQALFQTNAGAQVSYQRDLFDNEVASCFYPAAAALLETSIMLKVELTPRDPFAFVLAPHAISFPFTYAPDEALVLQPYLQGEQAPELPFWRPQAGAQPTVQTLIALNQAFHQNLRYERREEGEAWAPSQTIAHAGGSCRDFTVLLAATLRRLGVAARLVSGYVVETGERERRAEGALHAWVEAYLPGAGWIGLDPTNGILCDHHHIATAVGLQPDHIAPSLGTYYHPHFVTSEMTSTLQVRE